ncbi:MAG: hypothetical protein ABW213_02230 [Tardiphaga sp.]|jgi:hypothetical protein
MVSFNKVDEVSPTDPLYYAPRQPRSVRDLSSKPFVVPEDAWAERQPVVKAMPHPLSPEIVPAPPETALQRMSGRAKWQLAAATSAAVIMAAALAFVAVGMLPGVAQKGTAAMPPAIDASSSNEQTSVTVTPAEATVQSDGSASAQDATTPDQSGALLQQFLNWDKNKGSAGTP